MKKEVKKKREDMKRKEERKGPQQEKGNGRDAASCGSPSVLRWRRSVGQG